jgi:hypothetical protein
LVAVPVLAALAPLSARSPSTGCPVPPGPRPCPSRRWPRDRRRVLRARSSQTAVSFRGVDEQVEPLAAARVGGVSVPLGPAGTGPKTKPRRPSSRSRDPGSRTERHWYPSSAPPLNKKAGGRRTQAARGLGQPLQPAKTDGRRWRERSRPRIPKGFEEEGMDAPGMAARRSFQVVGARWAVTGARQGWPGKPTWKVAVVAVVAVAIIFRLKNFFG